MINKIYAKLTATRVSAIIGTAVLALAVPGIVNANTLIQNGSFEDTANFMSNGADINTLGVGSIAMPGWTVIGQEVLWVGPANPYIVSASHGGYFLDLTSLRDAAPFGGISQSFSSISGKNYRLDFNLGSSSIYGYPDGITVTIDGISTTFLSTSNNPGPSFWETKSLNFSALGTNTLISFVGASGAAYIGLDNVRITDAGLSGAVPEPAAWLMMIFGFGLTGLATRRRNKRTVAYS